MAYNLDANPMARVGRSNNKLNNVNTSKQLPERSAQEHPGRVHSTGNQYSSTPSDWKPGIANRTKISSQSPNNTKNKGRTKNKSNDRMNWRADALLRRGVGLLLPRWLPRPGPLCRGPRTTLPRLLRPPRRHPWPARPVLSS